jgi:hypothetical protein
MAFDIAIFVSKRLQRVAAAILCLMAVQLLFLLANGQPEPMAARVAITR